MVDAVLARLWMEHVGESWHRAHCGGGYGRGELFPQSDIDILILSREACQTTRHGGLERFIASLWDTGLTDWAQRQNASRMRSAGAGRPDRSDDDDGVPIFAGRHRSSPLADNRHRSACGPPNDFIRGKLGEQQNRHDKYSNTEYALEPNIKSSPGGLRDYRSSNGSPCDASSKASLSATRDLIS
jgi:[protein-PII] uridylyltransferase